MRSTVPKVLHRIGGRTLLDAVTWQAHPAIYGHTMLVLAALLAIVVPSAGLRVLALALGAVGVVLSGAREAMFAWLIIAVGLRFLGRRGGPRDVAGGAGAGRHALGAA